MIKFLKKIQQTLCVYRSFILFVLLSSIFILVYPNSLYPDFDNLDRNFRNVIDALFSGSTIVQSRSFGGSLEEHNLFIDQLFLTPQLKLIQFLNFYFDVSIIKNKSIDNIFIKLFFFLVTASITFCLIFVDDFISNNEENNIENNLIFISSLLFPGVLMSTTAASSEAVFSVFAIFLFTRIFEKNVNFKQLLFYLFIFMYCYFLDSGNWLLLLIFIFNITISYSLIKFNKSFFYIIFLMIILFIFLFVNEIIYYLGDFTDSHKIKRIVGDIQNTSIHNREFLDIIKRYLYLLLTLSAILTSTKNFVFTSLIFITYLVYTIFMNYYRRRVTILSHISDYELIVLLNVIFFPFVVVYVLPLHAYGKYYIFLIPIIFKIISIFISLEKLAKLNTIFTILFVINIIIIT